MPIFDQFQRAGFDAIEFPVEEITIEGGIRDHVHEYPRSPGGAPEKLGRRLYVIRMRGKFHATFRAYPNLYPRNWNRLRNKFESETSADLVIPTLGTVTAYCTGWTETATARQRSGVTVDMVFREDEQEAFRTNALVGTTDAALPRAQEQLVLARISYTATQPGTLMLVNAEASPLDKLSSLQNQVFGYIDQIDDAVNEVLAIRDQVELEVALIDAKVQRLMNLCEQLARLSPLGDPLNEPLRDANQAIWAAANQRRRDLARQREQIIYFETPIAGMSVGDVSRRIYGDASRSVQIMQLNPLPDPFNIARGTLLKLYRPSTQRAA